MPNRGQANNPGGVNNYDPFQTELPYGEISRQQAMAGAVPLAGGKVAASAIQAPKRAGKQARAKPKPPPPVTVPGEGPAPLPPGVGGTAPPGGVLGPPTGDIPWGGVYPPGTIANSVWQQILAQPGASRYPILRFYAGR